MSNNSNRRRLNQKAKNYDVHSFLQQEIATRLEARLDYIRISPQTILDLGAATGFTSQLLTQRYPKAQIIACDEAENLLRQQKPNRRWFSFKKSTSQSLLCSEGLRLSLADNSVDLVFSSLFLPWYSSSEPFFEEVFRILKPGGLLLFSSFGPDTFKELKKVTTEILTEMPINTFKDMHDVGDILLRNRFVDPVMDMEMLTLDYENFTKMMADLRFQNVLSASSIISRQVYQQCRERYRTLAKENYLPLSYEIIYGHAWMSMNKEKTNANQEFLISLDQIVKKSLSSR
jgi:malonyl-CoA O-methyltransferase